jgi:leucyl/phenylalanyl-tRNA--protein transferase
MLTIPNWRLKARMASETQHVSLPNTAVAARRAALFRETPLETLERWTLGTAWVLKPERIAGVPSLARAVFSGLIRPSAGLPDPEQALQAPAGLCGIARDLSVPTVMKAYERSLFPFAHLGPLKWFSPAERCVLFFDELRISKDARRMMRQARYTVTFDRDFEGVVKACSGRRGGKWHVTWITPRIMRTFADLFDAGHVHSFEVWNQAGELVGGGYGLAAGGVFFTESQFSNASNTSKIGFAVLNWHLAKWGYTLNDGKYAAPALLDMGFRMIPRATLQAELDRDAGAPSKTGRWQIEADLPTVAEWNRAVTPSKKAKARTIEVCGQPSQDGAALHAALS